jgi:SNW domain-containing protein 1
MMNNQLVLRNNNDNTQTGTAYPKPSKEQTMITAQNTKTALEKLCQSKIKSYKTVKNTTYSSQEPKIVSYIPMSTSNSTSNRLISITSRPVDPLENIKFTHRKIPHSNPNDPVPVMHSPQRKITAQDQRNWKIPPCISSSKNPKGLVIPLDLRIMADGRNLKEYKANPNFSKFADVLFIAEKSARAEIEERNRIQESIQMKATLKKEEELKLAAKQARMEKAAMNLNSISNISSVNTTKSNVTSDLLLGRIRSRSLEKEKNERDELRKIRKKEIEYNRRVEMSMKGKKKHDRDISEKIALGQAQPTLPVVDPRLYSQVAGIGDGFKEDSDNDLYDKPLFDEKITGTNIYKTYYDGNGGGDNSKSVMEKIMAKGKMFEGVDVKGGIPNRNEPVQFERGVE